MLNSRSWYDALSIQVVNKPRYEHRSALLDEGIIVLEHFPVEERIDINVLAPTMKVHEILGNILHHFNLGDASNLNTLTDDMVYITVKDDLDQNDVLKQLTTAISHALLMPVVRLDDPSGKNDFT